jgi:hypothetical protein
MVEERETSSMDARTHHRSVDDDPRVLDQDHLGDRG